MQVTMEGKVALVTGASGGIGLETARLFAESDARVVLVARRTDLIEAEVARLTEAGHDAIAVTADVTDVDQVSGMVAQTLERFGRLDYAVNNAGVVGPQLLAHELPEQEWDREVAINLKAVWLCMKSELEAMLAHGAGAIVNVSSVAGLRAVRTGSVYTATKHGVVGLTRSAGVDYADKGIRVNAVCPGFVSTPMTAEFASGEGNQELMDAAAPMGRTARPGEVAQAAVWLCSDAASFITAATLAVDGGMTA